jgi:hypothetical protein
MGGSNAQNKAVQTASSRQADGVDEAERMELGAPIPEALTESRWKGIPRKPSFTRNRTTLQAIAGRPRWFERAISAM